MRIQLTRCGVAEECDGAEDHGTRFDGGIGFAMGRDGDADGRERDGGSCAEEACEALGAKDLGEDGEEADDDAADQEARDELPARCMERPQAARRAFWIMRMAASNCLQPSSLYFLPSRR